MPLSASPSGWEAIARACQSVSQNLSSLAQSIADKVKQEIPAYAQTGISASDHHRAVSQHCQTMLQCMAENRDPRPEELVLLGALGARRAVQGLPVHALIQAYHIGYREIWQALVSEVTRCDPNAPSVLLHAVSRVWSCIDLVSGAVASAHQEAVTAQEAAVMQSRERFMELLLTGDIGADELAKLARLLEFRPDGLFLAACVLTGSDDRNEIAFLQTRLKGSGGTCHCTSRGQVTIILAQDIGEPALEAAIRQLMPEAPVGYGVARPGFQGARLSVGDAELALGIARRRGGSSRFGDDWLVATLLHAKERLRPVFAEASAVARENPHLAAAVTAFASSGFSLSEAARRLPGHPNTVAYRLERWRELTGLNPRVVSDLVASLVSIEEQASPE